MTTGYPSFYAGKLFVDTDPALTIVLLALMIAGALLVVVGLPASYLKQAKQVGWLGLCGFGATLLASILLGIVANGYFLAQSLGSSGAGSAQPSPLFFITALGGGLMELIGGVLFGVMTIRARVFPAAIGWLLIVAGIVSLSVFLAPDVINRIGGTVSQIILFLAFGWMGYRLAFQASGQDAASSVSY